MKTDNRNLPLVVIFGRPNVGKSTLFNCLIAKKQAIVSPEAGTTRDSNIGEVEWQGIKFEAVDTGGIMDLKHLATKSKEDNIDIKVQQQARDYLKLADLILFLVDNKSGLLPQDKTMSLFLKKTIKDKDKILLIANKADNIKQRPNIAEFNKLSLGEPIPVSAANGSGTGDLLDIIIGKLPAQKNEPKLKDDKIELTIEEPIKVAIIGQPNVGKSSLLNSIIGYDRVIVSQEAHTTREPQDTKVTYKDKDITLIDTAGISKRGPKSKGLEKHGIDKSLAALKKADIALLVLDISQIINHQDLKLVEEIVDRNTSLIIIANKWDLVPEKDTKKFTNYIYSRLPFATWAPLHFASALTGSKVQKIFDLILDIASDRKLSLSESQLQKLLARVVKIHKPTKAKGTKRPHIFELKQIKVNPPIFTLRIGSKDSLHRSYARFIANQLRGKYVFLGTPLPITIIKNKKVHSLSR